MLTVTVDDGRMFAYKGLEQDFLPLEDKSRMLCMVFERPTSESRIVNCEGGKSSPLCRK
jgi:hypothetical protein